MSAISRRETLFARARIASILSRTVPLYHRVYTPGQVQFITASTYRRTPVFRSERFCRCFVQRLDEVRRDEHFRLADWVLMPDHFHLLIRPEPDKALPLIWQRRFAWPSPLSQSGCLRQPATHATRLRPPCAAILYES